MKSRAFLFAGTVRESFKAVSILLKSLLMVMIVFFTSNVQSRQTWFLNQQKFIDECNNQLALRTTLINQLISQNQKLLFDMKIEMKILRFELELERKKNVTGTDDSQGNQSTSN